LGHGFGREPSKPCPPNQNARPAPARVLVSVKESTRQIHGIEAAQYYSRPGAGGTNGAHGPCGGCQRRHWHFAAMLDRRVGGQSPMRLAAKGSDDLRELGRKQTTAIVDLRARYFKISRQVAWCETYGESSRMPD
jgi:hypothetical protein